MKQFVISRFLQTILVFFSISVIVFLMLHLAPGDPLSTILGTNYGKVAVTDREVMRHNLGLDQPLTVQYINWLTKALQGDLGRSYYLREQVFPILLRRLGATALLALAAMILAVPVSIAAGVGAAVQRNSIGDQIISALATIGICTPSFFLGIVLIIVFSLLLRWLPTSGMHAVGKTDFLDLLKHLILPSFCLAAPSAAIIARMTRSSMVEALTEDYVTTARAKGMRETWVVWRHAFRNSLVQVITVVGLQAGFLLGGAVLVEVVFSWPGIGMLMWESVLRRDFPTVQGAVLLVASSYVGINFIVDLLYGYIDPRIRLSS